MTGAVGVGIWYLSDGSNWCRFFSADCQGIQLLEGLTMMTALSYATVTQLNWPTFTLYNSTISTTNVQRFAKFTTNKMPMQRKLYVINLTKKIQKFVQPYNYVS